MPRQTLTNYIKRTSDDVLDKIFHLVIAEMNRRKAKKQNVDVGFWDSNGNYTEDIQPVDADELAEILRDEKMNDSEIIVLLGEIRRLRQNVKILKEINNRLVKCLNDVKEENKRMRNRLKEEK